MVISSIMFRRDMTRQEGREKEMKKKMFTVCTSIFLVVSYAMAVAGDMQEWMVGDKVEVSEVTIFDDMSSFNRVERWKVNKWYRVPFDVIVSVQTDGATIYATADIYGLISLNNVNSRRGSLHSAARYTKLLGGFTWEKANDYFNFPVRSGEVFMVHKHRWSPKPDWLNVTIQVIPFPSP